MVYQAFTATQVSLTAHFPTPEGLRDDRVPRFNVIYEGEVKFEISLAINIHLTQTTAYRVSHKIT